MEDYITKVRLLPVCNCGHIFREGLVIYKNIHEMNNGAKIPYYTIEPPICPNCKKKINCMECYDDIKMYIKEGF